MAMDSERRDMVRRSADASISAAEEVSKAVLNLWRTRLDLAISMDDETAVRQILKGPQGGETGLWDNNTNCGSGCGGGGGTALW